MQTTIAALAEALQARAWGETGARVTGAAEPSAAGPEELALALEPRYGAALKPGAVALIGEGMDPAALGLRAAILVGRPRLAMAGLTRAFDPGPAIAPGIHPSSVIDPSAEIGAGAAIGPFVVIGAGARIGPRARLAAHVTIGAGAVLGADALLHEQSHFGARCRAGDRLILQPGARIGGDGFAFVTEAPSGVEEVRASLGRRETFPDQPWQRIHSLGTVEIGDDVEIGANTAVDRGTIRATVIGSGTKIDNLVQIGHNVVIGRDAMICGQVGIAGSTRIGDRVVLGGRVAVSDNISVGDDVVAGGAAKIYSNVPARRVVLGDPAVKMETELELRRLQRRLPRLFARVAALEAQDGPGQGGGPPERGDEP